jgi:molybdate transport system substrate-binding protein
VRTAAAALAVVTALLVGAPATAAVAEPVRLAAAGSLRAALDEVGAAFAASPGGATVDATYGPSGLLRGRIGAGEAFEVFASANMEPPRRGGARAGAAGSPVRA